jgi:lipopolysaccharide export system protein LptA
VRLTQGSILFQADKVIVFKQARQLQKVVAYGGPVRLRQKMEADKGEMRAEAQQMEYLPESDRLFLQGDARLWQGGSEFSGERIEYQLKNEVVGARGDKKQDGRVHIVIQPKNEAGKSAPATAGAEQP